MEIEIPCLSYSFRSARPMRELLLGSARLGRYKADKNNFSDTSGVDPHGVEIESFLGNGLDLLMGPRE